MRSDVTTDPAFRGGDCSRRTCPKGNAWIDVASADHTAHAVAECSNQGDCDEEVGECACKGPYYGKACEFNSCPESCMGNGVCVTQEDLIDDASSYTYSAWDKLKIYGCECDLGYRGHNCALKECPTGADVLGGHGITEGRPCGSRGNCNEETGICECYFGYYGTKCESQTTVM